MVSLFFLYMISHTRLFDRTSIYCFSMSSYFTFSGWHILPLYSLPQQIEYKQFWVMWYSVGDLTRKSHATPEYHPDFIWTSYLLNLFGLDFDIGQTDCSEFFSILFDQISLGWCYALWVIVAVEVISSTLHFFLICIAVTINGFCSIL